MTQKRILVVEDENLIRESVRKLLNRHGYVAETACTVQEAEAKEIETFDLVITDQRLPGEPGLVLIDRHPTVPVLVMTSYASLRAAVDTMRSGAVDYISKPFEHGDLVAAVERALGADSPHKARKTLNLVCESTAMKKVEVRLQQAAKNNLPVFIVGATGTGKTTIAKHIHHNGNSREKPFVVMHGGTDADKLDLLLRGESSVRLDAIGILYLHAVDKLTAASQQLLIATIHRAEHAQHQTCRIICSAETDPLPMVENGKYSRELYYLLDVMRIDLPSLDQRSEDLPSLCRSLLTQLCASIGIANARITDDALQAIAQSTWRGNLRELKNTLQRALLDSDDPSLIDINQLQLPQQNGADGSGSSTGSALQASCSLEEYFTRFVLENQATMSETELAKQLGISRKSLWERRQRLGIPRKKSS